MAAGGADQGGYGDVACRWPCRWCAVGLDAEALAGEAVMQAEAHQHLVHDHQGAVRPRHRGHVLEVAGIGDEAAGIGHHRLEQHGGDVVGSGEEQLDVGRVVEAHASSVSPRAGRSLAVISASVEPALPKATLLEPAVIAGRHLGDLAAAGDGPGRAGRRGAPPRCRS